ncbi:MAG: ATP-binding cassette domain-containing protein [Pseudomonadota bacterium]
MPSIRVSNVCIDYPIYQGSGRSLRHTLFMNPIKSAIAGAKHVGGTITRDEKGIIVRSLDEISFAIDAGERVGLVGQNGAGKSTLLRALAGIYEPNQGSIETDGKVVTFFNTTEGLSPEATGREMIETRGVLLGLSARKRAIMAEDVIEFCELGDYLEMPVRTYSSGMLVRLSFAIATSITADVLLFDELIGAGDARFYEKAKTRLETFIETASIMVVATHSRDILHKWCSRCFLMEHGKLITDGPVEDTLRIYDERRAAA